MFAPLLLTTVLAGAPIPAAGKAPEPIATIHFAPIERLEKDFFRLVQSMPMPDKDAAIGQMRDELKRILGEKGWDGLDTKKPGTGYIVFDEKNPEKSYGFLMLPITEEKKALDFLVRFGKSQNESNEVVPLEGVTGVYKLKGKNEDGPPKHVRMVNGYCYFGINAPLDAFAADKLLPAEKTLDPKETALVAVTVRANKLPKEHLNEGLRMMQQMSEEAKGRFPPDTPKALVSAFESGVGLVRKYAETIMAEGESFGLRLRYEDDLAYEFFLAGKEGSKLASEIAARPATTNQFAGLMTDKAVGGLIYTLPFLNDDLQTLGSTTITKLYQELCEKDPPPADQRPLFDKLVPSLARTMKSGHVDFAAALHGPDAKGSYTAVVGLALDDALALTPEFRKLIDAKAEGIIEWDAAEEAGVKIHTANVVPLLPAEVAKLFGNKATCHFALTKQGVILALGNESLAEVKRGIGLKPVPAAVMDMKVNFAKLPKVIEQFEPRAADQIGAMLGKADKLASLNSVTITGGKELRVTVVSGIAAFATGVFSARGGQ
jgi:hypothetical protein